MSISGFRREHGTQTNSDCQLSLYETEAVTTVLAPTENGHCNLIAFLATVQACGVDFLNLVWYQVDNIIAIGGTADIRQRIMSDQFSFVFKGMSLPRISGDRSCQEDQLTKERRAFQALITEISILSHPFIREHQNIVRLEGVCWEISAGDEKAWPVLVFEKAELGDLHQFMKSNTGKTLDFQRSLQLCSNIGGAIAAMHAGNIIHGDLKPENVLMFADKYGNQIPKVLDFGYSTLAAQDGDLIHLPISRPWNAPEIHHRGSQFKIPEAKKMDAYSFGILCLWILFNNKYETWLSDLREAYGDDSIIDAHLLATVENMKGTERLPDLAHILVAFSEDVTDEQRTGLTGFFQRTLATDLNSRTNEFVELLELLGDLQTFTDIEFLLNKNGEKSWNESTRGHSGFRHHHREIGIERGERGMNCSFRVATHYVDFLRADFRVRNYIVRCLEQQAEPNACEECRLNAAFQMALCLRLGFAKPRNERKSIEWLEVSKRASLDIEVQETATETATRSYILMGLSAAGLNYELDHGQHYRRCGILEKAEEQINKEIEDMLESLGSSDPSVRVLKYILSSILEAKADHAGAEGLRRELRNGSEEGVQGSISNDINLAITLKHRGNFAEAGQILDGASEKLKRRFGNDGDFTLVWLKTVQAELFQEEGRYEMAEKAYRSALRCEQNLLGSGTETQLQLLSSLALSLCDQDRSEEAETMFEEVVRKCKFRFGEGHVLTKRTLQWLADAQFQNGKHAQAEETYQSTLLQTRQHFGGNHMETVKVSTGLATIQAAQGKFREAEVVLETILTPLQDMAVGDNVEVLEVLSKVSLQYMKIGRSATAAPLMQRTREEYQRRFGLDHPGLLAAMGDQALAFYEAGKLDEAEELYKTIIDPMMDKKHPTSAQVVNNYGLLLTDRNDLERAEKMHRWAWEVKRSIHDDDHPVVLSFLNNIGRVLNSQRKFTEAEDIFRKVLDARVKRFGHDNYHTLRSYFNWASVLFNQGRLNDAEASYRRLLEAQERVLGLHRDVIGTMRILAIVFICKKNVAEGKAIRQRAFEASEKLLGTEHPLTRECQSDLLSMLRIEATAEDSRRGIALRFMRPSRESSDQPNNLVSVSPNDVWLGAYIPHGFNNITSEASATESELVGSSSRSPRCLFHSLAPIELDPTIAKRTDYGSAEHFVTSDVDEQLLLFIRFRRTVKIRSIQLTSLPNSQQTAKRPRTVKLFINRINCMWFTEADEETCAQMFTIDGKDWNEETGTTVLDLYYPRFQNVNDMVIFVSEGQSEHTRLDRIRLIGK